jgi:hippurate hydrolase
VFWLLGGADPALSAGAGSVEEIVGVMRGIPSNHSPMLAPVPDPTLGIGVATLVAAARSYLGAVTA